MKSPYLSDLKPNQVFTTTFLVHGKDVRQKKSGEPYLSLLLGDRTGEVDAKMWDNVVEVVDTFERDDFVKVKGLLQIFQNRLQMTVHKMARVLDADVDFADFFPASTRDPMEMFAELRALVAAMRNPHLQALLECIPRRRTTGAHVSHRAGRQARPSCLPGRIDRACAFRLPVVSPYFFALRQPGS